MEPIDPKFVPKLARKVAQWQKKYAGERWAMQALSGTKFVAPPSLPPLILRPKGLSVVQDTAKAMYLPDEATVQSHSALAGYYAETLERASSFYLSSVMTILALRTAMPKYKLTLDMLPKQKPWGFITWEHPIGQAENHNSVNAVVDLNTGEIDTPPEISSNNPFGDADLPVVAASWRYEPEDHSVWVAFYTQPQDMLNSAGRQGMSKADLAKMAAHLEPLALEREQKLPLDQELNWCHADPIDGERLEVTAVVDASEYPKNLQAVVAERNCQAQVEVSSLVKNLVASWMLLQWKIATQETIPPPQDVIRKVAKERNISKRQASEEAGTTVVRLGKPIQRRHARKGDKQWTWSVQAIVGPFIRHKQYIPAWDVYDEEPRFIEPYFAGPPDAPIRNIDKVFLLED